MMLYLQAPPSFAKLPQTMGPDERQYFEDIHGDIESLLDVDILCCAGRYAAVQPVLLMHRDILFDGALCKF